LSQVLLTISNGLTNFTSDFTLPLLADVPWTLPSTTIEQLFTYYPISLQSVCSIFATQSNLYGVGCDTGATYGLPGVHPGLDFFAPVGAAVYSMRANGLVVGVSFGPLGYNSTLAGNWGAADVIENPSNAGYSVIVRYGHLYVLYGHLQAVDAAIYVGKKLALGDKLGIIGTSTSVGAISHLHIEIRSFGQTISDNSILVKDFNGGNNAYGILANNGLQAFHIYEAAQFFGGAVNTRLSDTSGTTISVTGLGKNIVNGSKVRFETTTPPTPCAGGAKPEIEYCSGVVGSTVQQTASGYRGFILARDSVVPPEVEPTTVTSIA
jgi:murein DD-endopeptidase MepM/ murein hydrolase activator NlpD